MDRRSRVLVVGGTHGNERNAPWLLEHWRQDPARIRSAGLDPVFVLGNPQAWSSNQRYVERDLNRCFAEALLQDPSVQALEVQRARQLLEEYGPDGREPCAVAIDLHSTTSAMGNCLVVYGRRPADLALAAGIQARLGLPIYLHEGDPAQTGFLVERWPCGVVIEVGPVPQGVVQAGICRHTQLGLEAALAVLGQARSGRPRLPAALVVHRHLRSLDLPRRPDGSPRACIHPQLQSRDWQTLPPGSPLFFDPDGGVIRFEPGPDQEPQVAVFINEAAYGEKGIALSLTRREEWPVLPEWSEALMACASRLAAAG